MKFCPELVEFLVGLVGEHLICYFLTCLVTTILSIGCGVVLQSIPMMMFLVYKLQLQLVIQIKFLRTIIGVVGKEAAYTGIFYNSQSTAS